jgi:hypothetical protein
MRSCLNELARELVSAPDEDAALTNAYQAASVLVRRTVEAALPPSDMQVLRKYDCARIDDCIRLNLPAGGVVRFQFDEETGPLSISGCGRIFNADDETMHAVNAWQDALRAQQKAISLKLSDYGALIAIARNYEDVVEVWPEAEQLRSQFDAGYLTVFSPDVIARIRSDVQTRTGSLVAAE